MVTRRQLLTAGAAGAGALFLPWGTRPGLSAVLGTLDPTGIPKYQTPLVIPPAMSPAASIVRKSIDFYSIAVRQFRQQVLPPGLPATTVWGYGNPARRGSFHAPSFTIEATTARPVRVKWINDLVDAGGRYLAHLLPVDPTLHWANPPGGVAGRDGRPTFGATPGPYTGPVPFVTHLHGGHSSEEADGYAEAWYLPDAVDIPAGYATTGSFYDRFRDKTAGRLGVTWDAGTAVFQYGNEQRAATLWFHDHTLGMTRLNVYAGPAGFYLLRGGPDDLPADVLPGPAPRVGDSPGTRYYEIPLAIQDRTFNPDGSLFFPSSRAFFDAFGGPYVPHTDVSPIWNPEFFGDAIIVNGHTWPVLTVEPRRYRFRILNGCNSRFLILKIVSDPLAPRPADPVVPFWQVGTEGGFLPAPVQLGQLLVGNAERADVVVDFTAAPIGTEFYLINEGPDEPFGGGVPGTDFEPANPATTGQVMKFVVVPATGADASVPPEALALPAFTPLGPATVTRRLSLNELDSETVPDFGPIEARLGTLDAAGNPVPYRWADPVTEHVALGATEVWEFHNFTQDAHPIHIHEVMFQVVDRQPFGGPSRAPEAWEAGFKDTVIAHPSEVTRVKASFDLPGRYVWHCHIVDHEDNEMMRPYDIG